MNCWIYLNVLGVYLYGIVILVFMGGKGEWKNLMSKKFEGDKMSELEIARATHWCIVILLRIWNGGLASLFADQSYVR